MPRDLRIWEHPMFDYRRGPVVRLTFDGRRVLAYEGETVGGALLAAGLRTLARSIKFHRPRGIRCAVGKCAQCFVAVDGIPNVRACTTRVRDGMVVRSQNAWPSAARDVLRLFDYTAFLLKPGFQYRLFIRPRWLRPFFYRVVRALAGQGRVPQRDAAPPVPRRTVEEVPLVVIGGGPAGMAAALAAASAGVEVVLVEETEDLGGHLRYAPAPVRGGPSEFEGQPGPIVVRALATQVRESPRVRVWTETTAIGWDEGVLPVVGPDGLRKPRPQAVVIATGAYDVIPPFPDGDLPNVYGRRAIQRILHGWGVRPARRAVLLRRDAELAQQLTAAGMRVSVSEGRVRPRPGCAVISSLLRPCNELCHGIGCRMGYGGEAGGVVPDVSETLESTISGVFVAGSAGGVVGAGTAILQGGLAGVAAALWLGGGDAETRATRDDLLAVGRARTRVPVFDLPHLTASAPRGGIVCLCEDVTDGELRHCITAGYADSESLKRFSGIGMGPCQGKYCLGRMLEMLVEEGVTDPRRTRLPTQRPPLTPVGLAEVAGETDEAEVAE